MHPEDLPRIKHRLGQAAATGTDLEGFTYRVLQPDGSVRWIWAQGSVGPDRPGLLVGFAQDFTERRDGDERFRALLESAPDGM